MPVDIPSFDVIVRLLRLTFDFKEAVTVAYGCGGREPERRAVNIDIHRFIIKMLKENGELRGAVSNADDESVRWGERNVHHKDCASRSIWLFFELSLVNRRSTHDARPGLDRL